MSDTRSSDWHALSILTALLGVALAVVALAGWCQRPSATRHAALTALHQRINLGDDYGAVQRSYFATRVEGLDLHLADPDHWRVHTPVALGARNWYLFIDFRDDHVVGVRMRSCDGPQLAGSPPDKGEVPDPQLAFRRR